MNALLIVLLVLDVAIFASLLVYLLVKYVTPKKEDYKEIEEVIAPVEEVSEPVVEEVVEEPAPEVVEEPAVVEQPEEVVEEVVEEPVVVEEPAPEVVEEVAPVEEVAVAEDEEEKDKLDIQRVPFSEKMLHAEAKTQEYYDALNNEFLSYKKIHGRVSSKCHSYRFGRDLVAKINLRGKTLKVYFALDIEKFDENIYFQKSSVDVKAYEEVPFTVKVKSDRALKRAIQLIEALATEKGIVKKNNYFKVDSIEPLKTYGTK